MTILLTTHYLDEAERLVRPRGDHARAVASSPSTRRPRCCGTLGARDRSSCASTGTRRAALAVLRAARRAGRGRVHRRRHAHGPAARAAGACDAIAAVGELGLPTTELTTRRADARRRLSPARPATAWRRLTTALDKEDFMATIDASLHRPRPRAPEPRLPRGERQRARARSRAGGSRSASGPRESSSCRCSRRSCSPSSSPRRSPSQIRDRARHRLHELRRHRHVGLLLPLNCMFGGHRRHRRPRQRRPPRPARGARCRARCWCSATSPSRSRSAACSLPC